MSEVQTAPSNGATRNRLLLIIGVAVVALGVGAFFWLHRDRESTDDAQVDGHITPISSKVGGFVVAVEVSDNQRVQAGALLVRIDPREYQVAVERAEAELADAVAAAQAEESGVPIAATTTASDVTNARASRTQAEAGIAAAEAEIESARARLVAARAKVREKQAEARKARGDAERFQKLLANDEVSRQQVDAAVASADAATAAAEGAESDAAVLEASVHVAERHAEQARASLNQADAGIRSAQTAPDRVKVSQARASGAQARVLRARAALAQAKLDLEHTTVVAPAAGVISKKSVEVGQMVQPGTPLLAVVGLDDVWVTANFKETQIARIRVGQRATIEVDALGGRTFEGHVDSVSPATGARFSLLPPENASGNYVKVVQRVPIKITIDKGQDAAALRPGLSVTPTVYTR